MLQKCHLKRNLIKFILIADNVDIKYKSKLKIQNKLIYYSQN
jgi:hypothetical protein